MDDFNFIPSIDKANENVALICKFWNFQIANKK